MTPLQKKIYDNAAHDITDIDFINRFHHHLGAMQDIEFAYIATERENRELCGKARYKSSEAFLSARQRIYDRMARTAPSLTRIIAGYMPAFLDGEAKKNPMRPVRGTVSLYTVRNYFGNFSSKKFKIS